MILQQEKIFRIDSYVVFIALTIIGFEFISFFAGSVAGESRIVTVPYRAAYILIIIFLLIRKRFIYNVTIPLQFIPVLIFWIFYILKAISDLFFHFSEVREFAGEYFLFSIGLCFLPMFPMLIKINKWELKNAKYLSVILALIANIWGFKNNFFSVKEEQLGRFLGNEILNQISYGQTGVILIILSITSLSESSLIKKICYAGFIILGLANIGLAASRGPMIQLAVCLLIFIFINVKRIGIKNFIFLGVGVLFVLVYFADKLILFSTLIERLNDTGFNNDDGNAERFYLIKDGWQSFLDNPFLGDRAIGIYPHNLILEGLMALGILGGILMVIIFIIASIEALKAVKNSAYAWLGLILIMQILASLSSGSIYNSFLFWPIMALVFNVNHKNKLE